MVITKKYLMLSIIVLIFLSLFVTASLTDNPFSNLITGLVVDDLAPEVAEVHRLAKVYQEDKLDFDREYREEYLNWNKNFSHIKYKIAEDKEDFTLMTGNYIDDVRGFNISNNKFAIQLLTCNVLKKYCKFRVNGVPTTRMYLPEVVDGDKTNLFNVDENYVLKVDSAEFDQCGGTRFCHLGYEGYHLIDVKLEKVRR